MVQNMRIDLRRYGKFQVIEEPDDTTIDTTRTPKANNKREKRTPVSERIGKSRFVVIVENLLANISGFVNHVPIYKIIFQNHPSNLNLVPKLILLSPNIFYFIVMF